MTTRYPPTPVPPARPILTGGGTDSAAYGWFVWRHGCTEEPRLRWLDWSQES